MIPQHDVWTQWEAIMELVSSRFAWPGMCAPTNRIMTCFGLSREGFREAVEAHHRWREPMGEDADPDAIASERAKHAGVERAISYLLFDRERIPETDPDPTVEPIRHAAAVAARIRAEEESAERSEDFGVIVRLAEELARDPDAWVRGDVPPSVNEWLGWDFLEVTDEHRRALTRVYAQLAADSDHRVRASAARHSGDRGWPSPPADDPSPEVRAVHPKTRPEELLDISRSADLRVAAAVLHNRRLTPTGFEDAARGVRPDGDVRPLLVLAYRLGMPFQHHVPAKGIACEHELGMMKTIRSPEALAKVAGYWWPDEIVDVSREVVVEYEWFRPGGALVSARTILSTERRDGFSAAELLYALLRRLYDLENERLPHYEGDRHGLGKQRCLFQLVGGDGHWSASLRA